MPSFHPASINLVATEYALVSCDCSAQYVPMPSPQNTGAPKPYSLHAGQTVTGLADGVKASVASTGGMLTVIESCTAGGAPWHVHSREDEYFYVVAGEIRVWCGKDTFQVGPGSFVFLPRGIPHAWDVTSSGKATLLMMTAPAMLDEFLREFHAAGAGHRDVVAEKYGLKFFARPPE